MKRVLITGIVGFIGFHLAQKLKANHAVIGLDNFNDYYDVNLKKAREKELELAGIETNFVDLCDKEKLKALIDDFRPTHVVHLAAQAGVRYSVVNPDAYIQSNIVGFINLLECLKDKVEIPLIYASSSSVYGDCKEVPFCESTNQDCPINLYGATKKANEVMAYSYYKLYGLKSIGLRFFTVYGPWGRPDMAYYTFTQKIKAKEPIDVYLGDGIKRDFTYIDDIVNGIESCLDYECDFEVFNLGNNNPTLLTDFIQILEEAIGIEAIKNYKPQALGDMKVTFANIDKAQKELGFSPKTSLKEGLKKFIIWHEKFEKQLNLQRCQ